MLTHAEIKRRIALLPPGDVQQEALRLYRQWYPQKPPAYQRTPAQQALYDACRWDLALFGTTFFPHWCTDDFNDVHRDYYRLHAERQGSRGHRDAVAAPRESSKTTGCALLSILHACVYQAEEFIVYLTNIYTNAENKVKDCRDELEHNAKLVDVYGPQVGDPWNQADFTTRHGVRVMAAARNTQVRGITRRGARPSKIIVDDIEHPDHVVTEEQRLKTERWFTTDIMRLGQPKTNIEVSGTILHPDSLLKHLLTNPGWHARFYQSVMAFADPASLPLWQQWRDIFVNLANAKRQQDARTFYEAHRDAMTAGTHVLWPARKDYYALMVTRLVDGESSFWQELQNEPQGDTRYLFDMANAAYCTLRPEGVIRAGGVYVPYLEIPDVVGYLDPTPDKKDVQGSDYACCVVVAKDALGYIYVLDMYLAQEGSTARQIDGIVDLLWKWKVPLLGLESNTFQSLLASDIREAVAARAAAEQAPFTVDLLPIVNMRNKILRIKTLEPLVTNGWLQFAHGLPGEAIRQFSDFLPLENAGHDDVPDAIEGAVRVVKGLYNRRSAF